MFTTMAHEAHYVFLLTRTNLDAPKHKGLTMFLVPMDTPGIEVTPVDTMGGERTNITFYSDVRVPDSCRVGEVDAGLVGHARRARLRAELGQLGRARPPRGGGGRVGPPARSRRRRPFDDPLVREALARWSTELEVGRLLLFRSAWLSAQGEMPQVEGSMAKLHITEAFVRASSELLDLLGTAGLVAGGDGAPPFWAVSSSTPSATPSSRRSTAGPARCSARSSPGRALGLPRSR